MIILTTSKIKSEILDHLEDNIDLKKEDYECIFEFQGAIITVPYTIDPKESVYLKEGVGAEINGESYCIEDKDHFKIRTLSQDPNKRTLCQEIESFIEREERKMDEIDDRLNIMNDYKDHM